MENINVVDMTRDKSENLNSLKYLIESKQKLEEKIRQAKEAEKELVHIDEKINEVMSQYLGV